MSRKDGEECKNDDTSSAVFYEQLQSEYNKLLRRYAEAENTIDELRTGARIHLYSDSQEVKPNSYSNSEAMRHSQRIDFPRPLQAVVSSLSTDDTRSPDFVPVFDQANDRKHHFSKYEKIEDSLPMNTQQQNLEGRVQVLKENVDSLVNCLTENDMAPATINEVSSICNQLREDHKQLYGELKNRKQSRSSSEEGSSHFTRNNDLEKELLYRLGLRLQEIQQDVSGRLRSNKATQKVAENKARKTVKPTSVSSLDPELVNLVTKLKGLRDTSIKNNEAILDSSRRYKPDLSKTDDQNEQTRDHGSSESHDIVDARYLSASPVCRQYEDNEDNKDSEVGTEKKTTYTNDVDQLTYEDEVTADLRNMNTWDSSDLNNHTSDVTTGPMYAEQRMTEYDLGSFSDKDNTSDRSQSPISGPGNESHFHERSRSQVPDGFAYKHDLNVGENTSENPPRKSNSMSSLAGSSRMSTPLFHPRGATRVATGDGTRVVPGDGTRVAQQDQQRMRYKYGQPFNGFDSGFVGSEESRSSRMTIQSPDVVQKLNLSNQWDSSLHLDLSEINENDSVSSREQLSRTYEDVTEPVRRSALPVMAGRSPRDTTESTLLNSISSPLSSPDREGKNARYFGYSTSHAPSKRSPHDSSPGHRLQLADTSLSRISERQSSERSSHVEKTPGVTRDNMGIVGEHSRTGSREVSPNDSRGHRLRKVRERKVASVEERKIDASKKRDSLQDLRDDISGLRNQVEDVLNQSRVTMDIYEDIRREDEESRNALGRENDGKIDELRESIGRLRNEVTKSHRRRTTTNSDDDLRSQVKNLTKKLHELSELRRSIRDSPASSGARSASFGGYTVEPFSTLTQKVDELRLEIDQLRFQVKNESEPEVDRAHCRLCDDVTLYHHGYYPVLSRHRPRMSTSLLTDTPRQSTKRAPTLQNLSSSYPGVHLRSPVIHHVHTYHRTPWVKEDYETRSSSEESTSPKRTEHSKRSRRRLYQVRRNKSPAVLDEALHASRDVQRLSKSILNKISWDLASFTN